VTVSRVYLHRPPNRTAQLRHVVQVVFLLVNVVLGTWFFLWVRALETGAPSTIPRPDGIDGWLPIASLMNVKFLLVTGMVPEAHAAGMFLLLAFLAISFAFRKAFCSWLCPIGSVSEWLWNGGRELLGRTLAVPRWVDVPLRSLKYILLALFAWAVVGMSADDIAAFMVSPYGVVADVKLLDFFRHAGSTTVGVCSALVMLSIVTKNFWCRYLCPYGALMGIASALSPVRITRDPVSCIDCGKCTKACPSLIPVDVLRTVRTPECTGCLTCVSVCPVDQALELRPVRSQRRLTATVVAAGVTAILLGVMGYARVAGVWSSATPDAMYRELVPRADVIQH
jgi:polyferredoxin